MTARRFLMNAGRTSKQGQHINVGKEHAEYVAMVSTLTMHPEDMKALGIASGGSVRVRSEYGGEATFRCQEGKVPQGMIFVPYGPPTCRLMGSDTEGTGMPISKGWEVEVEPIASI
jgi:formylmethanofuran dehydrogenase subunit D